MKTLIKAKKPKYLNINYIKEDEKLKVTINFIFPSANAFVYQVVKNEENVTFGYGYRELRKLQDECVKNINNKLIVNKYYKYIKQLNFQDNVSAAMHSNEYISAELIRKNLKKGGIL